MPVTPDRAPDTGHAPGCVVTARQAADRAGVNERTIRRAIARGELPAARRRGAFAIDVAALDAWRARRDGAPARDRPGIGARHGDGIPEPVTALIGRERELATALGMLRREDVRLLTLTGAGGIGKTRLGLEVASRIRADFAGGVLVVPLAEVPGPDLVATAIADRLGIPDPAGDDARRMLMAALREARALLVLDNFEHVLAAAPLVANLLAACPHLKVLVTSRSLLRIGGEHALPVPPLALADVAIDASAEVAASPAVRLFADRARALDPSFAITAANAPAVAAICQRLGGLPLAIELAASQVTILPPDALLARIEAHLPLPVGGPRDVPDRQRTMTNAIAWSYALLSDNERRLFRRLGVFVGGFALDAVVAVGADAGIDSLVTLAALVDASLVQRAGDDIARYAMLEPIRAFALDRLAAAGELEVTSDALAGWCLALVERSPMAASVPGAERHLAHLGAEYPNIRRTLEWLHQRGDGDRLLRLAVALGDYWYERNHYRDGRAWTERALALGDQGDTPIRGRAMAQLGFFLSLLGQPGRGRDRAVEGIALLSGDDAAVRSLASIWLGAIEMQGGGYARAERAFAEALAVAETIPDPSLAAAMAARAMSNLGIAAHARGDLDGAARWHGQALAACRDLGYLLGVSRAHCDLAETARDRGDDVAALATNQASVAVFGERSDVRLVVAALNGAARAAASWGHHERAARFLGAAAGLGDRFGVPIVVPIDRTALERTVGTVREALGLARFDRHVADGQGLALAEAIAEVLAFSPPADPSRPPAVPGIRLSPREREVLRLLAAGHRDREIADELYISVRTVEGHVTRILARLGVTTRVAAARVAVDLGLADPVR